MAKKQQPVAEKTERVINNEISTTKKQSDEGSDDVKEHIDGDIVAPDSPKEDLLGEFKTFLSQLSELRGSLKELKKAEKYSKLNISTELKGLGYSQSTPLEACAPKAAYLVDI